MREALTLALLTLLFSATAFSQILPETLATTDGQSITEYTRGEVTPLDIPAAEAALLEEYGLQEAESAAFNSAGQEFKVDAWRLRDSTGAMALFQYLRPEQYKISDLDELAIASGGQTLIAHGNHLFRFTGSTPSADLLEDLYSRTPRLDMSSLPAVIRYLPEEGLIPGSGRYLSGPEALERFAPGIPPSAAAFSMSAEAEMARYKSDDGDEIEMAVFQYPTPGIARDQHEQFLGIPNTLAKRTGPLVAVIVDPADRDAAERLLSRVNYDATISWTEPVQPDPKKEIMGWGNVIITGFLLAGAVGLAGLLAGLGLGGLRALSKKLGWHQEYNAVTVLEIQEGHPDYDTGSRNKP